MPTEHRRHAITETPRVKEALDPLRLELDGERLDLSELVILGAEAELRRRQLEREDRQAELRSLAEDIRTGKLHLDPAFADEAKRASLPEQASDY